MLTDIYCLPGTMCDQRLWEFTQSAVASNVNLIHIAIPMEGSIELMVDALANVLPSDPVNVMGFSMGGYLGCAFAVTYPKRVNQLMVLSNSAAGLLDTDIQQRQQALKWIVKQGYSGIPKKKAIALLGERNKCNENLTRLIQDMDETLGESVLVQQLTSSLIRPDLLKALSQSSIPVCFCVGEEDALLSSESLVNIQLQPRFEFHSIARCGHMLPLEQPLWLAQIMTRFFCSRI